MTEVDVPTIRTALVSDGWFHAHVGTIERDDLARLAGDFGTPYETEESRGHLVSTYERRPGTHDERIGLEFHNEALYLQREPRYVFFYCAGSQTFSGGGTGLIDSDVVLEALSDEDRARANTVAGSIHFGGGVRKPYRLLRPHPLTARPSLCYAARFPRALRPLPVPRVLVVDSAESLAVLDRVDELCRARHMFCDWSPGTLLALDNYRVLHARYPVTDGVLMLWRALCD